MNSHTLKILNDTGKFAKILLKNGSLMRMNLESNEYHWPLYSLIFRFARIHV
jgi:metal-dependent hydrolase (beta-lactamase superfamily II)